MATRTRLTLRPGQKGTKSLVDKYGQRLLKVRYVYDDERKCRYKTVELIEEEIPWQAMLNLDDPRSNEVVRIRARYEEFELRSQLRQAGARWQPTDRVWQIERGLALALGLEQRIVDEEGGDDAEGATMHPASSISNE